MSAYAHELNRAWDLISHHVAIAARTKGEECRAAEAAAREAYLVFKALRDADDKRLLREAGLL